MQQFVYCSARHLMIFTWDRGSSHHGKDCYLLGCTFFQIPMHVDFPWTPLPVAEQSSGNYHQKKHAYDVRFRIASHSQSANDTFSASLRLRRTVIAEITIREPSGDTPNDSETKSPEKPATKRLESEVSRPGMKSCK